MNDYAFGNKILELRTQRNLSQTALADLVGVTNKAVSKWETGKSKPTTNVIRKLAALFKMDVNELLAIRDEERNMEILKVSAKSNPNSVAGALSGVVRENGCAEVQAIGAGALNQAVKAVAIARGFIAPSGVDLICIPAFADIDIEGDERTAIKLIVEPRYTHYRR